MKKLIFTLILLISSFMSRGQNMAQNMRADLKTILDAGMAQYGLVGSEMAVIFHDGSSFDTTSGNVEPGTPISTNRLWHYGPATQPLTAAITMMLHENGTLNIYDLLEDHIALSSIPYLQASDSLRINDLLSMTSNFTNSFSTGSVLRNAVYADPCKVWNKYEPLDSSYWLPSTPNPNREFRYMGWNHYYVLSYLLEQVTNQSIDSLFQSMIFDELGMNNSFLGSNGVSMSLINGAWLNANNYSDTCHDAYVSTRDGAGALISRPSDLVKFTRAYFSDSLLSSSTMDLVRTKTYASEDTTFGSCLGNIYEWYGKGAYLIEVQDSATQDTLHFYGQTGNGIGWGMSFHSLEYDFTLAFNQNKEGFFTEQMTAGIFTELACHVIVNLPAPSANFNPSVQGVREILFEDLSTDNPREWNWDFGDGNFSSEKNPTHTFATPGIYDVVLSVSNPKGTSDTTITIDLTGVEKMTLASNRVYPNPFSTVIHFDLSGLGLDASKLEVFDLQGKLVGSKDIYPGDNQISWESNGLQKGIYLYRIHSPEKIYQGKIIRQ